jgi:hypothetical protein
MMARSWSMESDDYHTQVNMTCYMTSDTTCCIPCCMINPAGLWHTPSFSMQTFSRALYEHMRTN